jgi:hypothetical protein
MVFTASRAKAQSTIPDLAPADLPRQQRRHINRALHKLIQRDCCSICGNPLPHNSRTAYGLDAQSRAVVAGQCCFDRIAVTYGFGLYSKRKYDFLTPAGSDAPELTNEQAVNAVALYQKASLRLMSESTALSGTGASTASPDLYSPSTLGKLMTVFGSRNTQNAHTACASRSLVNSTNCRNYSRNPCGSSWCGRFNPAIGLELWCSSPAIRFCRCLSMEPPRKPSRTRCLKSR